MKKQTLFVAGAHRGGQAITAEVLKTGPDYDQVLIADPKEDRADRLVDSWQDHGIRACGYREPCEVVVDKIDADRVVLAIDTVAPMAKVLRKAELPTQWQLLARGIGTHGPVIGLAGTLVSSDRDSRASSIRLIDVLSSFIEPQSSSRIRSNLLNADTLHTMRKKISALTSSRLGLLEREPEDIKGGPLNIIWDKKEYPLMVQDKPSGERWKEVKEQALDTALPRHLANSREYAVASIGNRNVDFFVIDSGRRRSVRFHMPLIKMLTAPASNRSGFLGALATAPLLAAAVVTD